MDDVEDEVLDPREAFCSTSRWFGSLICPGVVVVKDGESIECQELKD